MGKVSELRRLTVSIDKTAQTLLLKLDFFLFILSPKILASTLFTVCFTCVAIKGFFCFWLLLAAFLINTQKIIENNSLRQLLHVLNSVNCHLKKQSFFCQL